MASTSQPDHVFDILTRLSFEASDEEIGKANGAIAQQSNLVNELKARIVALEATRTQGQANYNTQLEKSTAVLQRVSTAQTQLAKSSSAATNAQFALIQVLRDTPSFANNVAQGFMAISNNLPILADNYQKLKAETGSARTAFSQLAAGLFSFQGIMSIGITLLTVYGAKLAGIIAELLATDKAFDKATASVEALGKAFDSSEFQSAAKNVSELRINVELARDGFLSKEKVLKQYNETVGKTTGQVKEWADLEKKMVDDLPAYLEMMLYKAAAMQQVGEAAKRLAEAEKNRRKAESEFSTIGTTITATSPGANRFVAPTASAFAAAQARANAAKAANKAAAQKRLDDAVKAEQDIALEFQKKAADIAVKHKFDIFDGRYNEKEKKKRIKKAKEDDEIFIADIKANSAKFEADQEAHNLRMLKLELQQAKDRLKIKSDDVEARKAIIQKETDIQIAEANLEFEQYRRKAIMLGGSLEQVEKDRLERIFLIRQEGNQRLFDATIDDAEKQAKAINQALDLEIQQLHNANTEKQMALEQSYKQGEISYTKYRRELRRIKEQQDRIDLLTTIRATSASLDNARARRNSLTNAQALQNGLGDGYLGARVSAGDINAVDKEIAKLEADYLKATGQLEELNKQIVSTGVQRVIGRFAEADQTIQAAVYAASAVLQIEKEKNEALIAEQTKRVSKAKELASNGNAAILKAEEDRLDKLNAAKRRYVEQERALNAVLTISQQALNVAKAVGAVLEAASGDPYTLALRVLAAAAAIGAGIAVSVSAVNSAQSTGGYYKGGYTGDGNPKEEAGKVHKQEYVFDHKSTQRIGKDKLEALRYGRMEVITVGGQSYLMDKSVNYRGMQKESEYIRQQQFNAQFNTRRLESKLDGVIEAINDIPGASFNADAQGLSASMWGHIKHRDKMSRL